MADQDNTSTTTPEALLSAFDALEPAQQAHFWMGALQRMHPEATAIIQKGVDAGQAMDEQEKALRDPAALNERAERAYKAADQALALTQVLRIADVDHLEDISGAMCEYAKALEQLVGVAAEESFEISLALRPMLEPATEEPA